MLDGIVSTSVRYIASGSWAFAPSGNATVAHVGESDQVVAGQAVVDRERQLARVDAGAELLGVADRGLDRRLDPGLDSLDVVQLARNTDPDAVQVVSVRDDDGRHVHGRRVVLV